MIAFNLILKNSIFFTTIYLFITDFHNEIFFGNLRNKQMIIRFLKQVSRRFPRRLLILVLVLVLTVFLVSQIFQSSIENDEEWYKHPEVYYSEVDCEHDEFTMKLYDQLTELVANTLKNLGLTHFLCYGSLWGALRNQRTLEWDRNLDFCILHHELATIDEKKFHKEFILQGLRYSYNSRRGKYIVEYKTVSAEITVFVRVGTHMERVGREYQL